MAGQGGHGPAGNKFLRQTESIIICHWNAFIASSGLFIRISRGLTRSTSSVFFCCCCFHSAGSRNGSRFRPFGLHANVITCVSLQLHQYLTNDTASPTISLEHWQPLLHALMQTQSRWTAQQRSSSSAHGENCNMDECLYPWFGSELPFVV